MEQLQKAGIFNSSAKKCNERLSILRKNGLIKSGRLNSANLYYMLTPRGGEKIDLLDSWYSSRYRCAKSTVINQLVLTDFALAAEIDYLPQKKAVGKFLEANFDALIKVSRLSDCYYEQDGILHILVVDNQLSMKYFQERVRAYSGLPADLLGSLAVVLLVYSEAKKNQVMKLAAGAGVRIKVIKSNWKY